MSFWTKSLFAVAALCLVAGNANAITIPYGDIPGTNVDYLNIAEDTRDSPEALFGAPDVVGDTMDFDPLNFTASSGPDGPDSEIVDGQLNFTIMSGGTNNNSTFPIQQVIIQERGDYTLAGLGDVLATAQVSAPLIWAILEVNCENGPVDLLAPINGAGQLVFTQGVLGLNAPTFGKYALPDDEGAGLPWTGEFEVDMDAFLAAAIASGEHPELDGLVCSATKIEFSLDNTLSVASTDGASAFIAKKDSGVKVMVPEPSSISLLGFGVLLALRSLRRK